MRVNRVIKQYAPVLDKTDKEKVYTKILSEYSVTDISVSDFAVLLDSNWKVRYTPEKIGNSELRQKEENSRILREKIAELVASRICTDCHGLEKYEYLTLLLDYSGTIEAAAQNNRMAQVFLQGTNPEKTELFWEGLKPLLGLKESVLEGKTDEELAQNWEIWQPLFEQFSVLDKIIEEALQLGVEIKPEIAARMKQFQTEAALSIEMLTCRAGVVANPYYAVLNEEDIQKIDSTTLEKMTEIAPLTLKDYLSDNLDIMGQTDAHIKNQLREKLQQIGYKSPQEAVLGNLRGKTYGYDMAVEVLKTKRPIYVIGENRKLIGVIEVTGRDGFLKPIANRKQSPIMSDYLEKAKDLIQKMVEEKKPLSEEGVKAARLYMAKMVCYEKLLSEKKMGSGSLYQAIGEDEQKFVKASNLIYKDPVFEQLTKNITLEQLEDFVKNRGEAELNKRYVQGLMAQRQEKEEIVNVTL